MRTKLYIFFILFLIVLTAVEVGASYYFYKHPVKETITQTIKNIEYTSDKTNTDIEFDQLDRIQKQPKNYNDVFTAGWIPDYDIPNGLATIREQQIFDSVSPVWFYMNEDGSLKPTPYSNGPELTNYIKDNNWGLMPSIGLFDATTFSKVLNSPENMNRHIDTIVNMTVDNNYTGIDLDYEAVFLSDKKLFFEFLSSLSAKLKDKGKKLSFTVLPLWGDSIYYPYNAQTRKVEDYKRIADLVDELRIMTYDFYSRSASRAGPLAPLNWMEYVIKYTINKGVPREKIVLGVHTYSYDWSDRPLAPDDVDLKFWYRDQTSTLDNAAAYVNKLINKVKNDFDVTEKFNDTWGEMVATYVYKGQKRIIIYPNEDSFKLRKQLAADYGIKGISYWRIGGEDGLKLQ